MLWTLTLVIYVEDEAVGGQRISNATKSLLNILHAKQIEAFDLRYNEVLHKHSLFKLLGLYSECI